MRRHLGLCASSGMCMLEIRSHDGPVLWDLRSSSLNRQTGTLIGVPLSFHKILLTWWRPLALSRHQPGPLARTAVWSMRDAVKYSPRKMADWCALEMSSLKVQLLSQCLLLWLHSVAQARVFGCKKSQGRGASGSSSVHSWNLIQPNQTKMHDRTPLIIPRQMFTKIFLLKFLFFSFFLFFFIFYTQVTFPESRVKKIKQNKTKKNPKNKKKYLFLIHMLLRKYFYT